MARYRHNVYASAKTPRYVVLFDLQWQVVEYQRLEPACDLDSAMRTAMQELIEGGWHPENAAQFGFVFLNRNGVRRLLMLTERDPYDLRPQTFSPFK
jgi:hypothetical protein